ncbi:MAG TPA: hypothetical protein DIU15_12660 [Deltaproteobacteria bacterium]|nr:hypothetical protein [Deltaproteobacteria bacterium]HCP46889.1 hypothetical protein [Deltaproteobacteria bacterium]
MRRLATWTLFVVLAGCSQDEPAVQAPTPAPEVVVEPDASPVTMLPEGHASITPAPPPADEGIRARRRMDIDQLNASLRQVTGGIGWTEGEGEDEVDLFEELSNTLGRPDFIQITSEDLTPSLLFEKFLGDAARSVCQKLVGRETGEEPGEQVFFVHVDPEDTIATSADAIEANLRYLLLRYHGQQLDEGDSRLEPWSWLFESTVHVSGSPAVGWQAVCVGLITHPDFYSY